MILSVKNVLIINPWCGNIGPNTFLKNFYRNINFNTVKLTIIYPEKDLVSNEMEKLGITVIYNKRIRLRHIKNFYLKTLVRFGVEIYLNFFYLKILMKRRFEVCLVNTELYSFSLFLLWTFSNVFVVVHSLAFKHNGVLNRMLLFFQKIFVHKYLAVSNTVKDSLRSQGISKDVEVAYNGVEVPPKRPKEAFSDNFQVLSIVHPVPHKGAHHLIEVIAKLKESFSFKWTILGWYSKSTDKAYENSLIDQINILQLNNHIEILGNVDNVEYWYNKSDLMVHPSESESFGFVVAEAMSYGVPVIAFDVGALHEIIDNNVNGYLIPAFDRNLMADNIQKLFNTPKLRSSMGELARKKIEDNFDIKKTLTTVYRIMGLD